MILFDSKKVREEKKIYKLLLNIKDTSKQLKIYLPKTEEEFLKHEYKQEYIYTYKYSCNLMKNTQKVQLLNLKNVGECFDLIIKFVLDYRMFNLNHITIEKYIEQQLNYLIILAESDQRDQQSKENNNYLSEKLNQYYSKNNSSLQSQYVKEAAEDIINEKEAAKDTINEIKLREFNEKFPEYKEITAIILLKKAGIELSNDDNKIINDILEYGKSKDSDFSLEDLLIPFIEEKKAMGLQIDKNENEILIQALLDNYINNTENLIYKYAIKNLLCITLNFKFSTNIDFEDYAKKFEHFMQNYYPTIEEYIKKTKGR